MIDNNIQVPSEGFGSYLSGILPDDIALSAGAFSMAMQQIRNIQFTNFEKFAQVSSTLEVTTAGLDLVNGTDVPTNIELAKKGFNFSALGTGPNGGYTFSDFFGCMSGLPYSWNELYNYLQTAQTEKLALIYSELFLAVTWEQALVSASSTSDGFPLTPEVMYTGSPGAYTWSYRMPATGLPSNDGGGYGRGNAPIPNVTLTNANTGASVQVIMGTNKKDAGSNAVSQNLYTLDSYTPGPHTYGRLNYIINQGSWQVYATTSDPTPIQPTPPTIYVKVECPPYQILTVPNNLVISGGINGAYEPSKYNHTNGWFGMLRNPMNNVVESYINQANTEIENIADKNPIIVEKLNAVYNAAGTQLTMEQRARYTAISPVPIVSTPNEPTVFGTPGTGLGQTGYGQATDYGKDNFLNLYPNSIYDFVDALPTLAENTLPHMAAQTLEAISDLSIVGGQSIIAKMREERNEKRLKELGIDLDNNIPSEPDIELEKILQRNGTVAIAENGIPVDGINCYPNQPSPLVAAADSSTTTFTIPAILAQTDSNGRVIKPNPIGYQNPNTDEFIVTNVPVNDTPISNILDVKNLGTCVLGPAGNGTAPNAPIIVATGGTGNGKSLDVGQALEPGSLAGSAYIDLVPINLNSNYTSALLLPATLSVPEAIDEVIKCNCDCWI